MDTLNTVYKFLSVILSSVKVAAGGPLYWIIAGIAAIGGLVLAALKLKAARKLAYDKSKENAQKEQSGGKLENNIIEEEARKAEQAIEAIRTDDSKKKPRG